MRMTTEEVLLTVLTVAIVVLIAMVLAVLFLVLRIVKKISNAVDEAQHIVAQGSRMVQSFAPVTYATFAYRLIKIMKKRK